MTATPWTGAEDKLAAAKRAIALAGDPEARLSEFEAQAKALAVDERAGYLDGAVIVDTLQDAAVANGLPEVFGVDTVQEIIADALDATPPIVKGAEHEPANPDHGPVFVEPSKAAHAQLLSPLQFMDLSGLDNEPIPDRQWAIRDRVPLRQAGLFGGEGGTGKSILEKQKAASHVLGRDWLGSMPEKGPAFYIAAEDDKDEIHIRLAAIAKHYGATFKDLHDGGLHVLCLLGQDATLCAATGKSGKVETTALYRQIYEAAGDIKPKNISIDTLSRAFAGNEIDRVQVYAFAMHMQALALVADGSVTVLAHPSLAGIASGSGISGSTAWHGAFRFRQYLKSAKADAGEQPDNDLRELEFKKNQYGPTAETIVLRYQRGLFLPVNGPGTLDKLASEQAANDLFLRLLDTFERQGRNVGDKKTSPNYAPAMFASDPLAKNLLRARTALTDAMARLFAEDKIRVETYGRPSRPYTKLVRT